MKQILYLQKVNTIYLKKGFKITLHQKSKRCLKLLGLEADRAVKRVCVVHLVGNTVGWLQYGLY
jgi:hypothetical protein